jgi:hypothetical protein
MVKCEDCKHLDFTQSLYEYPDEWWGHSCDVGVLNGEDVEITERMIKANRKCPKFEQLKCVKCGVFLKHEYQVSDHDPDLCNQHANELYDQMARDAGYIA